MNRFRITGNIVNAFFVCHRKLWLYAHQLNPDPDKDLLALGRLISEESYRREKKEIEMEGMKIDLIAQEGEKLVVCEIKKSSKEIKAAEMQLLFYMNKLREKGIYVSGEIRIPKERKKFPVEWTEERALELASVFKKIEEICNLKLPPLILDKKTFCKKCAFFEFCYAG